MATSLPGDAIPAVSAATPPRPDEERPPQLPAQAKAALTLCDTTGQPDLAGNHSRGSYSAIDGEADWLVAWRKLLTAYDEGRPITYALLEERRICIEDALAGSEVVWAPRAGAEPTGAGIGVRAEPPCRSGARRVDCAIRRWLPVGWRAPSRPVRPKASLTSLDGQAAFVIPAEEGDLYLRFLSVARANLAPGAQES